METAEYRDSSTILEKHVVSGNLGERRQIKYYESKPCSLRSQLASPKPPDDKQSRVSGSNSGKWEVTPIKKNSELNSASSSVNRR